MIHQSTRFFLIAALIFVGSLLYFEWQKDHALNAVKTSSQDQTQIQNQNQNKNLTSKNPQRELSEKEKEELKDIPTVFVATKEATSKDGKESAELGISAEESKSFISVRTDVLDAKINPKGGDIVYLRLKKFQNEDKKALTEDDEGFVLLDESARRYYIAQSGLTGPDGPDSRTEGRAQYQVKNTVYTLTPDQDRIEVDLTTRTNSGVNITKQFVFLRGNYTIGVTYLIDNPSGKDYQANFYGRLKRRVDPEAGSGGFLGMGAVQTYTGAAIYTKDTPYKKITFKDMKSKPISTEVEGGWAAMLEHYFLAAWIPEAGLNYNYQTSALSEDTYAIGFVGPQINVPSKTQTTIDAKLYAGPEVPDTLEKLSPGLDLTVDYGILWPICKPIFWLLKKMFLLTHNWGVAIILTTIIIKLLFYRLSASSYRSMGNMRKMQPRIEALKERYGDDKQKFSQAVMELYKKEKINPVGGCLPVLVQIPVFIALYYVLLNSVELRQAPFMLWITDLSDKDPYYVLPILMGISMWAQQKMNPTPPDPVQAKVMMAMPIVFTVLFLNFPSGLVLYWLVNNVLSIAQQWYISRGLEAKPHVAK